MARVLITNSAINHPFCEFLAALQRATPFQGMVQAKIKNKIGEDKKSCSICLYNFNKNYFRPCKILSTILISSNIPSTKSKFLAS